MPNINLQSVIRQNISVRAESVGGRSVAVNAATNHTGSLLPQDQSLNLQTNYGTTRIYDDEVDTVISVLMRYRALQRESEPETVPVPEVENDI